MALTYKWEQGRDNAIATLCKAAKTTPGSLSDMGQIIRYDSNLYAQCYYREKDGHTFDMWLLVHSSEDKEYNPNAIYNINDLKQKADDELRTKGYTL